MISDHVVPEYVFREFLLWLLFRTEQESGTIQAGDEYIQIRVEDQLKLEGEGDVRQTDLRKGVPSISEEARTALQNGKLPTRMRLRLVSGDDEYLFVIESAKMELRAVRMPVVPIRETELKLDQRMFHLSQIYRYLEVLFHEFSTERLDETKWQTRTRDIHQWMQEPNV